MAFTNPLYLNSLSSQKSKEPLTTNSIEKKAEFHLETSTTITSFSYRYGGTKSTFSTNKNKLKKEREFFPLKHLKCFFLGARRGGKKKGVGDHALETKHCNASGATAAHCLLSVTAWCPSHLSLHTKPLSPESPPCLSCVRSKEKILIVMAHKEHRGMKHPNHICLKILLWLTQILHRIKLLPTQ